MCRCGGGGVVFSPIFLGGASAATGKSKITKAFTLLYFTLMARKGAPLGKPEKAHGFQSEPGARVLSRSSLFCEQKLVFL